MERLRPAGLVVVLAYYAAADRKQTEDDRFDYLDCSRPVVLFVLAAHGVIPTTRGDGGGGSSTWEDS